MGYRIAAATSDGIYVDLHFSRTDTFAVYQVKDDGSYELLENRKITKEPGASTCDKEGTGCHGCGEGSSPEVAKIADCRCVLCAGCGVSKQSELGRSNITAFVVDIRIDAAIEKIVNYYKGNLIKWKGAATST